MLPYIQPYIDFVSSEILAVWYLLAGVAVGIALGITHAILDFLPENVHKSLNDFIKRLQAAAFELKKGATESMGKVQEAANHTKAEVFQRANDAKKHLNGAVNRITANANGHAVTAG